MGRMDGSDEATVAQIRAGDKEAFQVLVERHSHSLFRLGFRMTGNEQDAEEVVQEAFLRAYRSLDRFESRANFSTWLYRIGVNSALDLMRTRQRHTQGRAEVDPAAESPRSLQSLPDERQASPERAAYGVELQKKLEQALARLTPRERAAFVLRHFEGQSTAEIARALGLRSSAAKNTVFRAVQKLREALEPAMSTTR